MCWQESRSACSSAARPEQIRHAVQISRLSNTGWSSWLRSRAWITYNDSKATNVDATIKALEAFPEDIPPHLHLILGGKDKGSDYTVLHDLLRQRVKRVYTIGAAAAKIESQIQGAAESIMRKLWKTLSGAPANPLCRAMSFFWLRPAPASISSRATNIAAGCSKRLCIRWRCRDRHRSMERRASRPSKRFVRPGGRPALHWQISLEPTQLSPAGNPSRKLLRSPCLRGEMDCLWPSASASIAGCSP